MLQALIPLSDKASWENHLKDFPHGPAHLWEYHQAINKTYQQEIFLYLAQAENFKAVCPLAVRSKLGHQDLVTPYGFGGLITQGKQLDFLSDWRHFLAGQNYICGYIATHPLFNTIENTHPVTESYPIYIIDLTLSLDELQKKLAKVHRYELRRWLSLNLELVVDKQEIKKSFYELYQLTLQRTQAKNVYHFNEQTLNAILESDATLALAIKKNNEIEAVGLFTYTAHIADYFLNAATLNGREHTRGLLWHAFRMLKEKNISALNLGGGIKPADALDQFKKRFGGKLTSTYVLKEIFNPTIFNYLCEQSAAQLAVDYFPPYYAFSIK